MLGDPVLLVGAGVLGLVVGSFLNVCIARLPNEDPADRSLLSPPSTCPRCKQRIAWRDNIPVLSWLWLRGKCRWCRQPISVQYPVIELLGAAIWVLSLAYYGLSLKALSAAVFGTILLGVGVIDARHRIIPDELSIGGAALGIAFSLAGGFPGFLGAVMGAASGSLVLWVVRVAGGWLLNQEAMGWGDIKLLATVGAFVGWQNALLTIFLGALVGSAFYLPVLLLDYKRWRRYELPFGVFLAVAAALTFVTGDSVLDWYGHFLQSQ